MVILWIVQDELYDTLPIIIRSPVFYLQVILTDGIIYLFLVWIGDVWSGVAREDCFCHSVPTGVVATLCRERGDRCKGQSDAD